jgi:hypothetical protein
MPKFKSAAAVQTEHGETVGFVGSSTTTMERRRDGVIFFPTPSFYPGEPTAAQLADPFLRIELGAHSGTVPTIEDALAAEKRKQSEARAKLQGLPTPVMKEVE